MKRILTRLKIIIVLLFPLAAFAQNYIPIPDSGGLWKETYWWQTSPFFYNGIGDTYIAGDTVFNDTIYKKIYNIRRDVFCSDIIISGPDYEGAIRQDSISQRVYYKLNGIDSEKLLYDFSLQVGDTLPIEMNWFIYYGIYVKDIDTILTYDNVYRRRWHLDYEYPYEGWTQIIEGIGYTSGLLGGIEPYFEGWNELLCFSIENEMIYRSWRDTCYVQTDTCTIVGLEENKNKDINIYPNPTTGIISISGVEDAKIELYSITGKQLISIDKKDGKMIDLSSQNDGIYIMKILKDGFIITKKVVLNKL